ncbi:MAG: HAMP domain-containing histidine kinase [Gemmatimonadetes bacterium]|nr:HAMP domain-containing histidine kinase [Gemmatimonadota bacterium]
MAPDAQPLGLVPPPGRHAAVLAEALHASARATSLAELFAALDALATGPLGALGVTVFVAGADHLLRVVHSGGAALNTAGAAPSPVFAKIAHAAVATGTPMTMRSLDTLPGGRDDSRLRALLDAGVRAIACIPCATPRSAPALLSVRYALGDALDDAEVDLLRDVALLVAMTMERLDAARPGPPSPPTEAERRQRHLALLGELVPAIIHDLNNPLTGISAFAELLEAEVAEPDQRESVGYIRREAQQAARLLKDLQLLARPTTSTTLVEINPLVESAARLRAYLLRAAGATLRVTLEPGIPPVQGDPQALLQLIMHLLARAESAVRQAEATQRVVEVTTVREPHVAVLHVTDSGPGMSPEALGRMFDAVPPTAAPAPAGSPGLPLVKAIVESHGGTVAVDGGPARSTRISVRLPLLPVAESRSPASR